MIRLDLTGLNCPLPVLKTKKMLSNVETGAQIKVITTDPASMKDLQDFCKKTGHKLIEQKNQNGVIHTIIERQ
ncbi:MAG: sulfurtransferase TusA family protein [Burkholderiales bacterium]|jgi:tRNA 2-thiouridine synthesizing protein A|nr:sulfurtransferase TusA family protein [Burkholderiales bacterium]